MAVLHLFKTGNYLNNKPYIKRYTIMFLDNSVLSMDSFYFVAVVISLFSDSAFGGYCTSYTYDSSKTYVKCGTWGWSRCPSYSKYAVPHRVCCVGWKNPGCSVPICNNRCLNGGWCSGPDRCTCPSSFEGRQCATKICSEIAPCYPGTCSNAQRCTCYRGFTDTSSGCLTCKFIFLCSKT
ncbi:anterior pharynx in excess protein 1-like [Ruditapes philippinarum]|uniref:anterior pharynx in excess protein 1-like n=1 Tax=Ruditapes philippinarum TaxID=129788 RepID=UPI00295BC2FE|nr:anterior pharynx in excess protein 1-like [Ruditapes philippinarum]